MKKVVFFILLIAVTVCGYSNNNVVATMEEFGKPESVTFGNGYMYVLEGTTIYIYKESDFTFVKKFGKNGEGPGELKKMMFGAPLVVMPHNDKVYISSSSKVSVFSKTGDFIEEHKIAPFDSYFPFGDKYVCMSTAEKDGNPQLRVLALFLADSKFKKGKLLYKTDFQTGMNVQFNFPIAPFYPTPEGDKLYITVGREGFAINEYNTNGDIVNKIRKKVKKLPVPADYKNKTTEWFKTDPNYKNMYSFFKNRISFREAFPPIFFMWPDGNRLNIFTNNMKGEDRECIITDTKGKEIKKVYLPIPHTYGLGFTSPYIIHKGHFYKFVENVDDETWELIKIKL